jgi:hypothetical protein
MFGYAPTVNDRSGEFLAAGTVGAAQTNAQAMGQIGQDIGGALKSIGGTIGSINQQNDMGDSAYEALGAIGEMYPGMKSAFTALGKMDPRTRRLASMSILDNLGAVSQLGIAGMNQQARAAQPYNNAAARNQQTISAQGGPTQSALPPRVNLDAIP